LVNANGSIHCCDLNIHIIIHMRTVRLIGVGSLVVGKDSGERLLKRKHAANRRTSKIATTGIE
jgi:hypothetical protein